MMDGPPTFQSLNAAARPLGRAGEVLTVRLNGGNLKTFLTP